MSHSASTKKVSAYAQRNSGHIAAPLESDSDPEFNSGVFVVEPKPKRGRKKKSATDAKFVSSTGSRKRKRRSEVLDEIEYHSKLKYTARAKSDDIEQENPLLRWFGDDLDLHSASEGDDNDAQSDEDELEHDGGDEKDEGEDEGEGDEADDEHMISRTFTPTIALTNAKVQANPQDDSATESDTEDDDALPLSIPLKRTLSAIDDSATESDTDPPAVGKLHSDSATESDSESELLADKRLKPRPGFPLGPDQQYLGALVLDHEQRIMVPAAINTYLREYQREGVLFFWNQWKSGLGALLGDDMGLGKTIQVISFLSAIMRKHGDTRDIDRRHNHVSELQDEKAYRKKGILPPANTSWPTCLIIAPATVVANWEREFETWGYFEVGIYNGPKDIRKDVLKDFKMGRLDVVITSFELALRDIALLDDLPWSLVIIDEVHRVKNANSGTAKAFHRFQSLSRFGLTGTAIQNNYMELWTILDWTNPKRLGTRSQWKGYVVEPLTIGQSVKATEEQRVKAIKVANVLKDEVLPNFFKRRTKDIIKAQMPEKTDHVVFCPLTSAQICVYKRILAIVPVQNLLRKDEQCSCNSSKQRGKCCYPYDASDMLSYMSVLIKIANHLMLILPGPTDTPEQRERNKQICMHAFPDNNVPAYGQVELQPKYCGKWRILEQLLHTWHEEGTNKVLIFTKSIKLITMLAFHLKNKSYGFLQLDGSVPMAARMPMIDEFHENPGIFVFLISTLAGGTGLNLTGANKVVIFDPNWNPAHDLQAMDRAYRFGQTRDVFVYRLLGAGSIEELIYARQLYKQQQMAIGYDASIQTRYFEGVQNDTSRKGELFGIKNIFKLHEDTLATKAAIEKANIREFDWAMANIDSKSSTKKRTKGEDIAILDADVKGSKEDSDLRGLGAFLFDDNGDGPPKTSQQNEIQKSLNAIGAYTHLNNLQLLPTGVEEVRYGKASKKRRKSGHKASVAGGIARSGRSKSPELVWPPVRKKHKPPESPQSRLSNRQGALIELGMIHSPDHLADFAQDFNRKSVAEQLEILRKLDDHAMKNR